MYKPPLLFLIILSTCLTGCVGVGVGKFAAASATSNPNNPEAQELDRFQSEIRELLSKQDFASLEKMANGLRTSKGRFAGGDWKLYRFYQSLTKPAGGNRDSQKNWQTHMDNLSEWLKREPSSVTAHVAMGGALTSFAWRARGDGYAGTVNEEGWKLFAGRLDSALEVMIRGRKLPTPCPHWYAVMQEIAMGQGWDRESYENLFEEAIGCEPLYIHLYSNKAQYLMPRWYGEEGDWEKFADETANRVGGKEGSMLYSHIAWRVSKFHQANKFFRETKASWPRVKQGFIDREELYGSSNRVLNAFAKLATGAGDKIKARGLFHQIGDNWDDEVWDDKGYFDRCKEWTLK